MMENKQKSFTNIVITFAGIMFSYYGTCDHYLIMKLLAILQVKTGKCLIKEPCSGSKIVTNKLNCINFTAIPTK